MTEPHSCTKISGHQPNQRHPRSIIEISPAVEMPELANFATFNFKLTHEHKATRYRQDRQQKPAAAHGRLHEAAVVLHKV